MKLIFQSIFLPSLFHFFLTSFIFTAFFLLSFLHSFSPHFLYLNSFFRFFKRSNRLLSFQSFLLPFQHSSYHFLTSSRVPSIFSATFTLSVFILPFLPSFPISPLECPRGIMVNALDCGIIVSEFELQSC